MLGEVTAFEALDNHELYVYSVVGRTLLVIYLIIVAIMLLNLLIAVLRCDKSMYNHRKSHKSEGSGQLVRLAVRQLSIFPATSPTSRSVVRDRSVQVYLSRVAPADALG